LSVAVSEAVAFSPSRDAAKIHRRGIIRIWAQIPGGCRVVRDHLLRRILIFEAVTMDKPKILRGGRNQQVARAGEYFVVAELNKRGAYAVSFTGNMPKIDLMACNRNQNRTVHIQVKTKSGGRAFQTSISVGERTSAPQDPLEERVFWVFVDLGDKDSAPRYWIAPDWWVRNDIYEAHSLYLDRHGGKRPRTESSTHHSIEEKRLIEWQGRWDILAIFD
jgi:hypothetical protein